MKTISQIQQEVLATAQVTLDELQASIEKFWEQGWERNEEAKRTCQSSKWITGREETHSYQRQDTVVRPHLF